MRDRYLSDPCRYWLPGVLLVTLSTACLSWPSGPSGVQARDPLREHVWTIILTGDSNRVWVVQSDTTQGHPGRLEDTLSAAIWTSLDGAPDQTDLVLHLTRSGPDLSWTLELLGAPLAAGRAALWVDALYLIPRSQGKTTLYWDGAPRTVTFDVLGGTPLPPQPMIDPVARASDTVRAPAVVSLRIDDCSEADTESFVVLRQLGLTAEVGVPSTFVNRADRCSVQLLNAMVDAGNAVESHSRTHGGTPATFGDFYLETVGSLRDLRAWGFYPHDFIQPGSWNIGPSAFDNPAKMQTPYAALVRRTYVAMEAYWPLARSISIPATGRFGPLPYPIANLAPPTIDSIVRAAVATRSWIEFMWHSTETPPAVLAPRLAVIAALRDSGLVVVLPFYAALHATH